MSLFHEEGFTYFRNDHTDEPLALGLAVMPTPQATFDPCYYLSATGPPAALRSIWASLVRNNSASLSTTHHWNNSRLIRGNPPIKHALKGFKRLTAGHLVAYCHSPELILITSPEAATTTDQAQRTQLTSNALPLAYARLEAWLQNYSTLPVYPGLGADLWPHLRSYTPPSDQATLATADPPQLTPLQTLTTYGDCLGAWLINPDFPWQDFVCSLLKDGIIRF